ncbi:hypothetical protein OOK27_48025 [Streptomyces canus]|uniref:hypothetical protein n=1 Tax=Streptomyces canus TaxID=58343 RepID=UPI002255FACA|nr:hypothetical protein [Streptomyces canus]MCX5261791.1 hypothetical protein [Streptomyces canus]
MSKELQPQFHPAGFDDALRPVLEDVRAGRWRSMRDLLEDCPTWGRRTSRSQVLAAAAADGDAVEAWLQEEPHFNAVMMQARVSVERALNARRAGQRDVGSLTDRARAACWEAARGWPADPVPWVGLLTLAQLDSADVRQRRPEHRMHPWEYMLPYGPWGLLREVQQRDPGNREAWHRMLQALQAYRENAHDFVRWVQTWAPKGSPLVVLPLQLYAEHYGEQRARGSLTPLYWTRDPVSHYTRRALEWWFNHADPTEWSPVDLNHLAQALHSGGFPEGTGEVFEAIGPFATPAPWRYVADKPERWLEEFERSRRRYLPDSFEGPLYAGRRR